MAEPAEVKGDDAGARRGRKPDRPDPQAGPVAALADQLWRLKLSAGDPSFAQMSSRLGAAASKSSLAAAARGRDLPSWGTTWEFVRVLAVDGLGQDAEEAEHEWRLRWEQARDADADARTESDGTPIRTANRLRPVAIVAATIAGFLITGVAVFVAVARSSATQKPAASESGDNSQFEGDVTYPDGTAVNAGAYFTKVWRIRNTGRVRWRNRYLMQIGQSPCQAPRMVQIPTVYPGNSVDISVRVHAAATPARCRVFWKMTDADQRLLLTEKNPIFLDVRVRNP
ncbi:NBR1-Ig-like domain-containing protein [Actinoallomurus acanthiterrae]